jgi:protein-tyrosine phosphatase
VQKNLLKHGLVHIIASDAHDCTGRPPVLSRALKIASAIIGTEETIKMLTSIPQAVIEGKRLEKVISWT